MERTMNILNTMDKLHHYRTWVVPQAMRKAGILSEGYNPAFDRYEHKFLGCVFKVRTFKMTEDIHSLVKPALLKGDSGKTYPFYPVRTSNAPFVSPKKKFEVVFPKGEVRRYSDAKNLAKDLTTYRHWLTRFSAQTQSRYYNLTPERRKVWDKLAMRRTGFSISQLGCDPASVITIRNLATNACLMRQCSSLDLSVYRAPATEYCAQPSSATIH